MVQMIKKAFAGLELYGYSSVVAVLVCILAAFAVYPVVDPQAPMAMVRWGLMKTVATLAGMVALGGAYYFFNAMTYGEIVDKVKDSALACAAVLCTFLLGITAVVIYAG